MDAGAKVAVVQQTPHLIIHRKRRDVTDLKGERPDAVVTAIEPRDAEHVGTQLDPSATPSRVIRKQALAIARAAARFSLVNPQPQSEIFTKFADVKSRISWTAALQQQLQLMWDRGDKASDIATVLGCKVGAVNVARARFGLKPRRIVSGRPKEPDEPTHKIERVAFTTSRLMEFCSEKELVAQTGHEARKWPLVIVKELVDNAIDACEEAEVAPVVKITIKTGKRGRPTRIVIEDNARGIPAEVITGVIDYNVRVSSREAYISPTRGRQGNALKTILPMAYVLGGKGKGETWIEARGRRHRIQFTVNQIKQEPVVHNVRGRSRVTTGTRVTVFWPQHDEAVVDRDEIKDLLTQYIWVNPHLTLEFTVDGKSLLHHRATNPDWTKYRACDATSSHWYTLEQIERYAGALIARDQEQRRVTKQKYTVREFIAQFRGLSATEKQKQILRELGASHMTLARFFGSETQVNRRRMEKLLKLLQQHTRPVRPELLGVIGEEHLCQMIVDAGGEPKSFKYSASPGHDASGLPYMVEIAACPYKKWVAGKQESRGRVLITGVNFSATLENSFESFKGMEGMDEILTDLRAGSHAPVIVCVHYASPHIEYLDRGKSRIGLE
jgi:DNA topoisomerase VI subunit B